MMLELVSNYYYEEREIQENQLLLNK